MTDSPDLAEGQRLLDATVKRAAIAIEEMQHVPATSWLRTVGGRLDIEYVKVARGAIIASGLLAEAVRARDLAAGIREWADATEHQNDEDGDEGMWRVIAAEKALRVLLGVDANTETRT